MFRKTFFGVLIAVGISVSSTTSSASMIFNFSQGGFDDGAIVTGMFKGNDLDSDGQLSSFGSFGNEFTAFNMAFSGNSLVSAFSLGFADLIDMVYDLDGGQLGDGEDGDVEGILAGEAEPYSYSVGPALFGKCGVGSDCAFVFQHIDIVNVRRSFSSELVAVSAVPLPAAVWLFGSGLFGLFGMRRITLKPSTYPA